MVDGVTAGMAINRDEPLGPVAAVATFSDDEDALRWANEAPLSVFGSLFTGDLARAVRLAERMQCGVVNINETSACWQPHTPFGGFTGKRRDRPDRCPVHAPGDDAIEDRHLGRRRVSERVVALVDTTTAALAALASWTAATHNWLAPLHPAKIQRAREN